MFLSFMLTVLKVMLLDQGRIIEFDQCVYQFSAATFAGLTLDT